MSSPQQKFSFSSQSCGWTGSCGSYDCETHVSNNHQGLLINSICVILLPMIPRFFMFYIIQREFCHDCLFTPSVCETTKPYLKYSGKIVNCLATAGPYKCSCIYTFLDIIELFVMQFGLSYKKDLCISGTGSYSYVYAQGLIQQAINGCFLVELMHLTRVQPGAW